MQYFEALIFAQPDDKLFTSEFIIMACGMYRNGYFRSRPMYEKLIKSLFDQNMVEEIEDFSDLTGLFMTKQLNNVVL